ncbi:MAG TPA: hypothetical protein VF797_12270, partial [Noviherbaspirillum sp.]
TAALLAACLAWRSRWQVVIPVWHRAAVFVPLSVQTSGAAGPESRVVEKFQGQAQKLRDSAH